MARYDRYGASRKRKKKRSLLAPIAFVMVFAAIVFGMGVFFRVQEIEVVGAVSYTDEEIIDASGVDIGDNLFFINRLSVSSRIFSRMPLVEAASIDRILPNKIIITVEESYAMAYVNWQEQNWMMTGNCKLLGNAAGADLDGLIHVWNVAPVEPEAGAAMQVAPEERLKLTYLQALLHGMQILNMTGDVSDLDMQNPADPTFTYLGRFTVKMGANENTDYKLRMLLSAIDQMESDLTGTIDLSEGNAVHVSPD